MTQTQGPVRCEEDEPGGSWWCVADLGHDGAHDFDWHLCPKCGTHVPPDMVGTCP